VTVFAHSYGSRTATYALSTGDSADALVMFGSPGVAETVQSASDLDVPSGQVFATRADADFWAPVGLGLSRENLRDNPDPMGSSFGAERFSSEDSGSLEGVDGHGILEGHVPPYLRVADTQSERAVTWVEDPVTGVGIEVPEGWTVLDGGGKIPLFAVDLSAGPDVFAPCIVVSVVALSSTCRRVAMRLSLRVVQRSGGGEARKAARCWAPRSARCSLVRGRSSGA